jgi:hypothetical protein
MKISVIVLILTMILSSCNTGTRTLSQTRIDSMTIEFSSLIESMIFNWSAKDVDFAFSRFSNSPDFNYVSPDGTIMDYATFVEFHKYEWASWKNVKFELLEKRIKIVKSDLVIALINYKCYITHSNSNIESRPKVGATLIFSKINDNWVVTHFQESFLTPMIVKPPDRILIKAN